MNSENELYALLKEIYFQIDNGDRQLLDAYSLSVPRFFLLKHIAENPGITLTRLSTLMLTDKSNITRLIKGVEGEGLVRKKQHATDGRALSLFLTDTGGELLTDALEAHEAYVAQRFAFAQDESNGLLHELASIKRGLEAQLDTDMDAEQR